MKSANKVWFGLALCILGLLVSMNAASATQVTVNFEVYSNGDLLDSNVTTSCESATADSFSGYEFMFWDNQGVISFTPSVTICPGFTNSVATAWYMETGGGGSCPPSCAIVTLAYSIDNSVFLPPTETAIALVAPNSPVAWTSPSNSVSTVYAGGEAISADSALAIAPYASEPFRYWQQLFTTAETPIGIVFQASQYADAYVVAFYGPDPCQAVRNQLQSCLDGDGEGGKLGCELYEKELQQCEIQNREIQ
jgi:hypothetical protein